MYKKVFKRFFDLAVALPLFIIVLPVLVLFGFLLFIANQGKVFFIQERPGLNGKPFKIIKFKTMNDRKDANGNLLPDNERLTVIGNIVRKTSIDELPQLLNVIIGDISLVGPRPLLMDYLPLYNQHQARRHEVRPGITGWAQVNGRNSISWEEKFDLDVYYVDHISFMFDLKIIFKTVFKTFQMSGISSAGHATMEKFTGTKPTNLEKK